MSFKLISIIIGVLIAVGVSSYFIFSNGDYIIKIAERETFTQTVDVSGKVIPQEEVDLSFGISGKVVSNQVDVGDIVGYGQIIATLDNSKLSAEIKKAEANLLVADLEVSGLSSGTDSKINNQKREVVTTLKNAFSVADLAIRNKTDQLFDNVNTLDPDPITILDREERIELSRARKDVAEIFEAWVVFSGNLDYTNVSSDDITRTLNNLYEINDYLKLVEFLLSDLTPNNTYSQSDINAYRTDVASARGSINTAIKDVSSTSELLRGVTSDLPIRQAEAQSSEASLSALKAQLSDYVIRSPFAGVITKNDLTVGQTVSANTAVVSLITQGDLEIEAFIPEISIANIKIGDQVSFVLDAFGSDEFFGKIISIDPSETLDDGVSTYRVLIAIEENEDTERIKSGMTADISIATLIKENVLLAPISAVFEESGKTFVYLKNGKEIQRKEVELGQKDSFGNREVLSGLNEGDKIILNFEE